MYSESLEDSDWSLDDSEQALDPSQQACDDSEQSLDDSEQSQDDSEKALDDSEFVELLRGCSCPATFTPDQDILTFQGSGVGVAAMPTDVAHRLEP